jgi:hypothetical protein
MCTAKAHNIYKPFAIKNNIYNVKKAILYINSRLHLNLNETKNLTFLKK